MPDGEIEYNFEASLDAMDKQTIAQYNEPENCRELFRHVNKLYPEGKRRAEKNLIRKYLRDIDDILQLLFRSDEAQIIIQHLDSITRWRGCWGGSKKKKERASLKKLSKSKHISNRKKRAQKVTHQNHQSTFG